MCVLSFAGPSSAGDAQNLRCCQRNAIDIQTEVQLDKIVPRTVGRKCVAAIEGQAWDGRYDQRRSYDLETRCGTCWGSSASPRNGTRRVRRRRRARHLERGDQRLNNLKTGASRERAAEGVQPAIIR